MNVFIVHAHPEPRSFCSALCWSATETLRSQGHEVLVSDLHADGFKPVADAADFGTRQKPDYLRYALEQRQAYAQGSLAADIQAEIGKLLWCDLLILNFPLYWFAPPALLKGWIDRVLIAGLCHGGRRFYDQGGLAGKRAMLSLTLGGQAHMFDGPDSLHGPLEDMLRPLQRGTLAYTGLSVLPPFIGWQVPDLGPAEREQLLQAHRHHLLSLDRRPPLALAPRMADFDERLKPRSTLQPAAPEA